MKIGIGNDHVAVEYKEAITAYIQEKYGYEVVNFGTDSTERFDYPIAGEAVADAVMSGEVDRGIVICGTGVGISLAANKVRGVRAALGYKPEIAVLARQHNDANVLGIGARMHTTDEAFAIVDAFVAEPFSGDPRHQRRIDQMSRYEVTRNT